MVKVKVPEEDDQADAGTKFTGLSKEELLQVAGTPAWVRTRWALLILFWLGWLGMLAGAIVIIVQAPRCKELPPQEWWHKGGVYRIQPLDAFQDSDADGVGDLAGVQQHMDYLSSLKVQGLVIGPIHVNAPDNLAGTNLTAVDPQFGTSEMFTQLLNAAKKKGLKVILDLTPNYRGQMLWFNSETPHNIEFQAKMKEALEFWLKSGVAGIQLEGVEHLNDSELLAEWKNLTSQHSSDDNARVLIAGMGQQDSLQIFSLLNETSADLLTSAYLVGLGPEPTGEKMDNAIRAYIQAAGEKWPCWSVGGPQVGHMASLVKERLLRLYHMLLFTLPGTPFTNYGDEIGLLDKNNTPHMRWNDSANFGFSSKMPLQGGDSNSSITVKAQSDEPSSLLSLFRRLSELRGKERSLLHGEFLILPRTESGVFVYLRSWDQNKRFLVALNFAGTRSTIRISHSLLPPQATVELSTDSQRQEGQLSLKDLTLEPSEGLLLHFPYVA
uniref:Solute carrier family 3 member 2 n=1 Tax=Pelusios castaneus TaxID=367368 RepID=A0A8C8VES6_9SAUR